MDLQQQPLGDLRFAEIRLPEWDFRLFFDYNDYGSSGANQWGFMGVYDHNTTTESRFHRSREHYQVPFLCSSSSCGCL